MKNWLVCFSVLLTGLVFSEPVVSNVTFVEQDNRDVVVAYSLAEEPAVVTFDVTTNGVSIGGENLWDVTGDVNRLVTSSEEGQKFVWRPNRVAARAMKGNQVKIVLTAWPTNDPPDYMVVNILKEADAKQRVHYYANVASLPGGLFDMEYRTSHLVMRKIPAAGVTWTMGSGDTEKKAPGVDVNREVTHTMKFPRNYYMGVFEVTRTQWFVIRNYTDDMLDGVSIMPMNNASFLDIRESELSGNAPNPDYVYPNAPCPNAFLGQLRTRTGVEFDLPSEAWWEYAARATWGDATWGDGSDMSGADVDGNLDRLGAYQNTSGGKLMTCGSFAPNDFGLYDMAGNVFEWCLDWGYTARHTRNDLADGSVQATLYDQNNPVHLLRGGAYNSTALSCRPARRAWAIRGTRDAGYGFRLACPADAK